MIRATRRVVAPGMGSQRPAGGLLLFVLVLLTALAPRVAAAAETYAEYHGLTSAQHGVQAATLEASGYRPISLSISGDPADPRYSGAWVQRAGPAFSVFQDQTKAEYESLVASLAPGHRPVIVSATGSDDAAARFASVIEESSTAFVAKQGNAGSLYPESDAQLNAGYILRSLTVYGSAADPKYAAIWEQNTQNVAYEYTYEQPASLQRQVLAIYTKYDIRPSLVVVTPGGTYSTIWQDDRLSGGWKGYNDLSQSQYEKKIASLGKSGWHVIRVTARGTGAATQYAVIFAKTDVVQEREWQVTGSATPSLAAFDAWVKARMQQDQIRAGQLAIVRDGRLVFAHGYTLGESGYPVTQPTDMFRVLSLTKPLTSIVVNKLIEQGALQLTDTMQSILDIQPPGGGPVADSRWNDITVGQMLAHVAGWDQAVVPDPLFDDANIAASFGTRLPVKKSQIESYMAGQPLQFTPGTYIAYSNFGFLLAGEIIEKLRPGRTYAQTVKDFIFKPLELKRPKLANSVRSTPQEVSYEPLDPYLLPTVMNSSGRLGLPNYGARNLNNAAAAGGWVMSAPDYAKVLAAFDQPTNPLLTQASVERMWTPYFDFYFPSQYGWAGGVVKDEHGNDVIAHHQNGSLEGGATFIFHRADGISFVLFFNRNVPLGLQAETEGVQLSDLANQVTDWPSDDLFPSYGIPGF